METSAEFPVTCSTNDSTSPVSESLDSHCIYQWTPEAFVTEDLTVDPSAQLCRGHLPFSSLKKTAAGAATTDPGRSCH